MMCGTARRVVSCVSEYDQEWELDFYMVSNLNKWALGIA